MMVKLFLFLLVALLVGLFISAPKDASLSLYDRVANSGKRWFDDVRLMLARSDLGQTTGQVKPTEAVSSFVSTQGSDAVRHAYTLYRASDFKQALTVLKPAAEKGDASAQNLLGILYAEGKGVEVDLQEAVFNFNRAARQGLADAQANLAVMRQTKSGDTQPVQVVDDKARTIQAVYEAQLRQTAANQSVSPSAPAAPAGASSPTVPAATQPAPTAGGLSGIVTALDPTGTLRATQDAVNAANERNTSVQTKLRAIEKP